MKRFTNVLLLLVFLALTLQLQAKDETTFFAKVVAPNNGQIYKDDSTVVSIYLYAKHPIGDIQINNKRIHIDGCSVRRIPAGQRQSISRINGQAYYTVLCAQYSVAATKKGKTEFPQLSVTANLYIEQESKQQQRIDPFFGPFDDFFRQPSYKKEKKTIHTPQFKMEVTDAPRKTMQELQRSGKTII